MLVQYLPDWMVANLGVIGLLMTGILVEKHFVGRMATFTNSIALNLLFLGIPNLHWILDWYASIGLLLGVLGVISYAISQLQEPDYYSEEGFPYRLPDLYYKISWLYSSIVVFLVALNPQALNAWLQMKL